jgi:glucoamylase
VGERAHYELACGRPVAHLIRTIEGLASGGGMLPEQVWDEADLPAAGMHLGRTAGSAMPLMWAHAEYVKLLRSVADAAVFDLIGPVAERYRAAKGRKGLEVWKANRQVRTVTPGQVLRVQAPGVFDVEWSLDDGAHWQRTAATPTSIGVGFADVGVPVEQRLPVRLRMDGREYELRIEN